MRIYVAAKTHEYERARALIQRLESEGHTITFDWTKNVEDVGPDHENEAAMHESFLLQCAENDAFGVKTCHVLVALGHPRVCGTLIEIGMALAHRHKIILIGEFPPSVFWHLPQVVSVSDEEEAVELLSSSWSIED